MSDQRIDLITKNLLKELKFDEMDKKSMPALPKTLPVNIESINSFYTITNHKELCNTYPTFLKQHLNWIAELVDFQLYDTKYSALKQINTAIAYMNYYNTIEIIMDSNNNDDYVVVGGDNCTIFHILMELYNCIKTEKKCIRIDFKDNIIRNVLCSLFSAKIENEQNTDLFKSVPIKTIQDDFTTQIVFDSADIGSAFDELANTWKNHGSLWKISNVWIQESIKDKFLNNFSTKFEKHTVDDNDLLIDKKLNEKIKMAQKLGAEIFQYNNKYSKIIIGVNRKYIENNHIIYVNYFRTPKELQTLLKSDQLGSSVSLWSENISLIYELIDKLNFSNIWCNCNGILNPAFPFTFSNGLIFGNEFDLFPLSTKRKNYSKIYMDGKYSFQSLTIQASKDDYKFKNIVIAYGATFAN